MTKTQPTVDGASPQPSAPVSDFSALARKAVARLCAETRAAANDCSAQAVLGSPVSAALAYALCDESDQAANLIVDDLLEAGVSVEEVCLSHLAPAARHLGVWWDTDRVPFTDVTLATARIQSMLRRMPRGRVTSLAATDLAALFVAVPGEQHTLGVMMAADMFRRVGWDVALMVGHSHDDIMDRVRRDDRLVIGLSCSGDHSFAALKRVMTAIRRDRPEAHVMVSGHITAAPERLADLPQPFEVIVDQAAAEHAMQRLQATIAAPAAQRHRTSC